MADKLYPPIVGGTLPSFYKALTGDQTGAVLITVPFSMNKLVSPDTIQGFALKIKNGLTDQELGVLQISFASYHEWADSASKSVVFTLPAGNLSNSDSAAVQTAKKIRAQMATGEFYKMQLAYVAVNGLIGYYSTIGIAKFTCQPLVSIKGLDLGVVNVDIKNYVGLYHNEDFTERVYQYKFTLYDTINDREVESSGWCTHNSQQDDRTDDPYESTDEYPLHWDIASGKKYYIIYSVITNNNIEMSTDRYYITSLEAIPPNLNATLSAEPNFDNGFIELQLHGARNYAGDEIQCTGRFIISRASAEDDFSMWTTLCQFSLYGQAPSDWLYKDFAIEQGITYRYAVQQYNDYGIYSQRIYATLYNDGKPWEFYNPLTKKSETTRDILAMYEDLFIYDGKRQLKVRFNPKVSSFKTIIKETKKDTLGAKYPFYFRNGIINYKEFPISGLLSYLSDNDQYFMSRTDELKMKSDWEDTTDPSDLNIAYERKFKLKVLEWLTNGEIKLVKSPTEGNYIVRLMNVSLSPNDQLGRMLHTFTCTADEVEDYTMANLEARGFFLGANAVRKEYQFGTIVCAAKLEATTVGHRPQDYQTAITKLQNVDLLNGIPCRYIKFEEFYPGSLFSLNGNTFAIGATGVYEMTYDEDMYDLRVLSWSQNMSGIITYGVNAEVASYFDDVIKVEVEEVTIENLGSRNLQDFIDSHTNIKETIQAISWARFKPRTNIVWTQKTEAQLKEALQAYIRNINSFIRGENLSANVWANIRTGQELILPDSIYRTQENNGTMKYWTYRLTPGAGGSFVQVNPEDTIVHYEDQDIDIQHLGEFEIGRTIDIPDTLTWGKQQRNLFSMVVDI